MYDLGSGLDTTGTYNTNFSFNPVSSLVSLAYSVLFIVALWKLFEKMGIEGWKAVIPVYNMVVLFQAVGFNPWLLLLWLVPCLGWIALYIIEIVALVRLAKKFGQDSTAFTILIIFFAPIALAVLAFDNKYTYNKDA